VGEGKGTYVGEPFGEPISRRVALQRAAQLGVAVAVVTPAVQGLGRVAAYASESDLPGQYRPPSNFQVEFTVSGAGPFALKFDPSVPGDWDAAWDLVGPGGSCFPWVTNDPLTVRQASEPFIPDFVGSVNTKLEGDQVVGWLFNPPASTVTGESIQITSVMMKDGSLEGDPSQCAEAVEREGNNYVIRVLESGTA
jgi:hypothetical protein